VVVYISRKISSKDKYRAEFKWAKIIGFEVDKLKERLDAVEKDIKELKDKA